MTARNTRTGGVLEAMILPALKQGGYSYKRGAVHQRHHPAGYPDVLNLINVVWKGISRPARRADPAGEARHAERDFPECRRGSARSRGDQAVEPPPRSIVAVA